MIPEADEDDAAVRAVDPVPATAASVPPGRSPGHERPAPRAAGRLVVAGAVALLAWPIVEVALHLWFRANVVTRDHWREAAAFVRAEWRDGDLVTAAPRWADPNMREVMGDRLSPSAAGRSDTAAFSRLWVMSIRGHESPEAPARAADLTREIGPVTVSRWVLPRPVVRTDLVERLATARVELLHDGQSRPCPWRERGIAAGGGVDDGPITPAERFVCDPVRSWLWVGVTTIEDMALLPRRCVWHHPEGRNPIRATFDDLELSNAVVLYGGIHYDQARDLTGGPVHVRVLVDGSPAGRATFRDADGWKRLVVDTRASRGQRHDLSIEVTAPDPRLRVFCWAASVRDAAGEPPPARSETW
ncbi:MAG: hypothetical protein IT379_15905 [Deltaproteobacteria bacterium]|nr:hypothetical protein [Deltaproteobacteria bacterium]